MKHLVQCLDIEPIRKRGATNLEESSRTNLTFRLALLILILSDQALGTLQTPLNLSSGPLLTLLTVVIPRLLAVVPDGTRLAVCCAGKVDEGAGRTGVALRNSVIRVVT